jgi:hypothetical protein
MLELLATAAKVVLVVATMYLAMYAVAVAGVFTLLYQRSDRSLWNHLGRLSYVAGELARQPRMVPLAAMASLLIVAVGDLGVEVPEHIPEQSA